MSRLSSILGTALILLLGGAVVFMLLTPVTGWRVDTVLSGSMAPALNVGDIIITRPVPPGDISPGDIITFDSGRGYVCHRVVSVEPGPPLSFVTKGDANEDLDRVSVASDQLAGKLVVHIPFAGYLSQFVKSPAGFILTIVLPGLLLVGLEFKALLKKER